jgi:hypothetical protein
MNYECISGKQTSRNRELTRIYANHGERDRPSRRVWCLAKHILVWVFPAGAGRETHPVATGTVALPHHRISEYSRLFASIRGSLRNSLICRKGLTQVVDFPYISTYFQWCSWRLCAVLIQFLKVQMTLCNSLISMIVSDNSDVLSKIGRAKFRRVLVRLTEPALFNHGSTETEQHRAARLAGCVTPLSECRFVDYFHAF